MPTHRLGRFVLAMLAALGLGLGLASPAQATSPVDFGSSQIVDSAGVLGSDASSLKSDLATFKKQTGVTVYVAFVDKFTNPSGSEAWAKRTVSKNGIPSGNTALLFVATQDRLTYIDANSASKVASGNSAASNAAAAQFRNGDWADGVTAALNQWSKAAGGGTISAGSNGSSGAGIGSILVPVLVIAVIGGIAYVVISKRRRRAKGEAGWQAGQGAGPGQAAPSPEQIAQQRQQAGPLLIAADDAIRTSEQELGFAEAAYGAAAVKTFQQDLDQAKEHLAASFRLQQALDDEIPDTSQEQYDWSKEIIDRCHQVSASLDAHRSEFDGLRKLESAAPQLAEALATTLPAQRQRLEQAQAALGGLSSEYADSAVSQVQDNVTQAGALLDFVQQSADHAKTATAEGKPGEAALAVRAGQQAAEQADGLIEAIATTRSRLGEARTRLEASVRAAAQDLAQAKAALASGAHGELAAPAAALETALQEVRTQLTSGRADPLALLGSVDAARTALDAPLASVRDQQEQAARAQEALANVIRSAESKIEGTEDFVKARRGGVGAEARTRLSEARRLLQDAQAMAASDPQGALASAQRADQLADSAAQLADQDVQGFQMSQRGGMGGGMNSMGGAILGGILGSVLLGGGSHHSGHNNDGGFFGGGGDGGFGGFGGGGGDFGGGFGGFDGGGGSF